MLSAQETEMRPHEEATFSAERFPNPRSLEEAEGKGETPAHPALGHTVENWGYTGFSFRQESQEELEAELVE